MNSRCSFHASTTTSPHAFAFRFGAFGKEPCSSALHLLSNHREQVGAECWDALTWGATEALVYDGGRGGRPSISLCAHMFLAVPSIVSGQHLS